MGDHITLDVDRQGAVGGSNTRIQGRRGAQIAMQIGRFAGRAVGALVFATLSVLEPFVRFILMTLARLGMFVTIMFGFLIGAEGFPKWLMFGLSVGCFLLLAAYYGVMSIFGNVSDTRDTR
jgi:NADH dehydrogenase FAD-containing subunit